MCSDWVLLQKADLAHPSSRLRATFTMQWTLACVLKQHTSIPQSNERGHRLGCYSRLTTLSRSPEQPGPLAVHVELRSETANMRS